MAAQLNYDVNDNIRANRGSLIAFDLWANENLPAARAAVAADAPGAAGGPPRPLTGQIIPRNLI